MMDGHDADLLNALRGVGELPTPEKLGSMGAIRGAVICTSAAFDRLRQLAPDLLPADGCLGNGYYVCGVIGPPSQYDDGPDREGHVVRLETFFKGIGFRVFVWRI